MADPHIQIQTDPPPAQTPLLNSNQNHNQHPQQQQQQQQQNQIPETDLDRTLQKLETFLTFLGFNQSSVLRFVLSWTAFVVIGVLVPVVILELSNCPGCEKGQIKEFELDIVASQACLAAVSLICMSHNLRKYGIRKFLFVDRHSGHMALFHLLYIQQIKVSSIVQVVGIILCLHAATKISHRAQNIATIASRWHALATCSSADSSHLRVSNSVGNLEASSPSNSVYMNYSESDLESVDYVAMPTNTQLASHMASYHRRQSYVMYLQANPGGITIFGWTVDRALINTIFFIELSLVTFVLGMTIINNSN